MKALNDISDLVERPHDYGFFTFEEFVKNRDKIVGPGPEQEALACVEKGGTLFNRYTKRHVYEVGGYRCKTLEEVERVARAQGIPINHFKATIIDQGCGKGDILVKFMSRSEIESRNT